MSKFFEKIKKIASENEKVAMFVDMDGTITVYDGRQLSNARTS